MYNMALLLPGLTLLLVTQAVVSNADSCIPGLPSFEMATALSDYCSTLEPGDIDDDDDDEDSSSRSGTLTNCLKVDSRVTFIMSYLNFTCDGQITKWRTGGVIVNGSRQERSNRVPSLLIWRARSATSYYISAEIPMLSCNGGMPNRVSADVYECELSSGVNVQPGDLFGVRLERTSAKNSDKFRLYFNATTSPSQHLPTYSFNTASSGLTFEPSQSNADTEELLPLVALEIQPSEISGILSNPPATTGDHKTTPPAPTTPTPTSTSTSTDHHESTDIPDIITTEGPLDVCNTTTTGDINSAPQLDTGYEISVGVAIGVALGVAVVITVLLLIIAIQCRIIARYRKKNQKSHYMNDLRRSYSPPLQGPPDIVLQESGEYPYAIVDTSISPYSRESIVLQKNKAYRSLSAPVVDPEYTDINTCVAESPALFSAVAHRRLDYRRSRSLANLATSSMQVLVSGDRPQSTTSETYEPIYY